MLVRAGAMYMAMYSSILVHVLSGYVVIIYVMMCVANDCTVLKDVCMFM